MHRREHYNATYAQHTQRGRQIVYKGACHAVTAIKTWQDNAHGRMYALDLEAAGKTLRVSVVEGARLEG